MTDPKLARQVASWFRFNQDSDATLLDAGSGMGALSTAFARAWAASDSRRELAIDAFEIDETLHESLNAQLGELRNKGIITTINGTDFITHGVKASQIGPKYTHAFLNPPYARIHSRSTQSQALKENGLPSTNLYSAFLGLTIRLMEPGGQIVAIVPRSFCNGIQFRILRRQILSETAIQRIHLIESRTSAFKRDGVIQENVIVLLERGATQGNVRVSFSSEADLTDSRIVERTIDQIVFPDDDSLAFRLSAEEDPTPPLALGYTLSDLGVSVATGSVVDFRLHDYVTRNAAPDTVPLIHAHHIGKAQIQWPTDRPDKNNSIVRSNKTEGHLWATGNYVAVRRFSSKEQARRIVTNPVIDAHEAFAGGLAFENHVNVLHVDRQGFDPTLAWGLSAYLNSSIVDPYFRALSGSTQVNASDLKLLPYPSLETLRTIGSRVAPLATVEPTSIDSIVESCIMDTSA